MNTLKFQPKIIQDPFLSTVDDNSQTFFVGK